MSKPLGSSWKQDRVAAAMLNKEKKEKAEKVQSQVKVYKTSELYTKEYGAEAYAAWVDREREIDQHMKARRFCRDHIVYLRELSFRLMKEGVTQHDLNLDEWYDIEVRPQQPEVETENAVCKLAA